MLTAECVCVCGGGGGGGGGCVWGWFVCVCVCVCGVGVQEQTAGGWERGRNGPSIPFLPLSHPPVLSVLAHLHREERWDTEREREGGR